VKSTETRSKPAHPAGAQRISFRDRPEDPAADYGASQVTGIAPQFLVDDLDRAIAYYRDRLGFELDFEYQSFYAGVSRDGFSIHLKHAPRAAAGREHRKQNEHLDAYISVSGIRHLFSELQTRGAEVIKPLEQRPWACLDFYVEDPDGNILCFSEQTPDASSNP
jgi:catechol 2,3-dioxygenase-like lactoylglutathione lyase family enzyme